MKITISQQNKKILIEFYSDAPTRSVGGRSPEADAHGRLSDWNVGSRSVGVDKAEDFLATLDRFLKKRKMRIESLQKADLEFVETGILTERIIRAIIKGLNF